MRCECVCVFGGGGRCAAASGSWGRLLLSQGRGNVPSSSPRRLSSHYGTAFSAPTHRQLLWLSFSREQAVILAHVSTPVSWMHPDVSRSHERDLVFRGSRTPPLPPQMTTCPMGLEGGGWGWTMQALVMSPCARNDMPVAPSNSCNRPTMQAIRSFLSEKHGTRDAER